VILVLKAVQLQLVSLDLGNLLIMAAMKLVRVEIPHP